MTTQWSSVKYILKWDVTLTLTKMSRVTGTGHVGFVSRRGPPCLWFSVCRAGPCYLHWYLNHTMWLCGCDEALLVTLLQRKNCVMCHGWIYVGCVCAQLHHSFFNGWCHGRRVNMISVLLAVYGHQHSVYHKYWWGQAVWSGVTQKRKVGKIIHHHHMDVSFPENDSCIHLWHKGWYC